MRNKLIELRKKRKFTQEEMAKKLRIARTTYTGYENGTFAPPFERAIEIKRILKTRKDDIFLISNDSTTDKKEEK